MRFRIMDIWQMTYTAILGLLLIACITPIVYPKARCMVCGHNLVLFAGEKYYRCPVCGSNEFGNKDRFGADQAPVVTIW